MRLEILDRVDLDLAKRESVENEKESISEVAHDPEEARKLRQKVDEREKLEKLVEQKLPPDQVSAREKLNELDGFPTAARDQTVKETAPKR